MRLIRVENVPVSRRNNRNNLQALIEEFAESDLTCARIECKEDEYKDEKSMRASITSAVMRSGYVNIYVQMVSRQVYLVKKKD